MAVDDDGDGANSLPDAEGSRAPDLAGLLREQKHHSKARNKQAGQPYCAESGLRATIKDVTKARGQRPQNRGNACAPASHAAMLQCAWELGLVAGYALREREVVGSIPAVPHRTSHNLLRAAGQPRDARTPDAGQ